jgi:hypothetical protein
MKYMNWSWNDLQELPARMYPVLIEEINSEAERIRDRAS